MHVEYLNFQSESCKNCYKCLRECPVKAITVLGDRARIREDLCVLCGHCTYACSFNAKKVVDDTAAVKKLLGGKKKVIASVAPAFVSSFAPDFGAFKSALLKLGFADAFETAEGAREVTECYRKLLDGGAYKNLIASACPSIVRLIEIYYPDALKYLAPVDSPMVAHARMLHERYPDCKVVFIGPCIAKKREADESGMIDFALTFEELSRLFEEKGIDPAAEPSTLVLETERNTARNYPINSGIIKSFNVYSDGYEYVSVDGLARAKEVLANIDTLSGMFIEMHACEFSCINGPCALHKEKGGFIKATETVRAYAKTGSAAQVPPSELSFAHKYEKKKNANKVPSEEEIRKVLAATGKTRVEDELNCGACGYNTCREKAIAVLNGMAEISMCVPFMRERAEGLSYDIIQNSPNGIIAVDENFVIAQINEKAAQLIGAERKLAKGEALDRFYNPADFYMAAAGEIITRRKIFIDKTSAWVEMTIRKVTGDMLFCIMKDITADMKYRDRLDQIKAETVEAANRVVSKQMSVVQEIASLLGETTAETKIALLKLRDTLTKESVGDDPENA
ncbi:MAG: PAS domain-containing protein [Clostridiales bacterium]|nr:PAS domain-containing protein [Clostridiales bacterium]